MPGPVDRRSDAVDERTLHAVAVREYAAQRRGHADGSGPQVRTLEGRVIGGIDTHDIGVGDVEGARRPIFVNTLYCCLATTSETASFRPLWRPKFLSALVPEDRCHLNGLAMDGARPAFVSAVSRSDVADGWRERRHDGGVVIDVASSEIVASGFSMPH